MKAPERIYLQYDGDPYDADEHSLEDDATWCSDRINDGDVEYIRSDIYQALERNLKNETLEGAAQEVSKYAAVLDELGHGLEADDVRHAAKIVRALKQTNEDRP